MIVLHARALLALAVAEPLSDWLLTQVARDEVVAPAHQPAWVLSELDRLGRAGVLGVAELDDAVSAVLTLPQRLEGPDARSARRVAALTATMTVADALHVALAERLDVPVVAVDGAWAGDATDVEVRSPPAWLRRG